MFSVTHTHMAAADASTRWTRLRNQPNGRNQWASINKKYINDRKWMQERQDYARGQLFRNTQY